MKNNAISKQTKCVLTLTSAAVALAFSSTASAAVLVVGDVIAVDLSDVGGSATNFNVFTSNTTIPVNSVNLFNRAGTADGVSLTISGASFNNDTASDGWGGTAADPYYNVDANDAAFETGTGGLSFTFAGLNTSLSYNVRVYSLISNQAGRTNIFTLTNGAGTETVTNSNGTRWNAATLAAANMVFNNVSPDNLGNIFLTVTDNDANHNVSFLNAVVLEVVPEPSTAMLLGAGMGMLLLKRRRSC